MTTRLPILDGDSWSRVIAFARDLNIKDAETQTDMAFGIRLGNVLKAKGWTAFDTEDFGRACSVIQDYYYTKSQKSEMGESEGFEIGASLTSYSVAVLVRAARIAHEHRRNPDFLRGLSAGVGYSASQMAKAASLWPELLLDEPACVQGVDECRVLFALASLPKEHAMIGYLKWRGDSSLTFYQMYQWVLERRSLLRIKDHAQYPVHRRKALGELRNMRETAKGERQEVIQGVIETVRSKL